MNLLTARLWPARGSLVLISIASFIGILLALGISSNTLQVIFVAISVTLMTAFALVFLIYLGKFFKKLSFSILIVIGSLILIGAGRGWFLFELIALTEIADSASLETRVLNSTLTIVIWGLIFLIIEGRLLQFRNDYRVTFSTRAVELARRNKLTAEELAQSIDAMDNIQSLQASLRGIADLARSSGASQAQLLVAAQGIRKEIENSLRPLSHRIWFDSSKSQPQFKLWELLKEALRNLRISWSITPVLASSAFLVGALPLISISEAFVRVGSYLASLLILLLALRSIRASIAGSSIRGVAVALLISLVANGVSDWVAIALGATSLLLENVLLFTAAVLTTFGVLWVSAILSQLRLDWERVQALVLGSSEQSVLNTRLAGYLHNSLQSQLSGIALALERHEFVPSQDIEKVLEQLDALATKSIGQEFTSTALSAEMRLAKIVDAWDGISSIKCSMPSELRGDSRLELLVEVVEEAISNAVRHSQAKQIDIQISRRQEDLQVVITHPTSRPTKGKARLGSLWLDRFSKEHKTDFTTSGERRLTVVL